MDGFKISKERRKVLGKELRKRRNLESLTINDTAKIIGVRPSFIERLEKGDIPVINPLILIKMGRILKVNYIILYQILGYVHNKAVLKYITAEDDVYPISELEG